MTDLVQNPQSYVGKAANDVYAIIMHFIPGITSWASKRRDNLNALVEKTKKKLERKGFSVVSERPNQMKTGVLLIESASLEEDDFLQERWATLLSNTLSPDKDINRYPQFVSVLKELTPLDAKVLALLNTPFNLPKTFPLSDGLYRDEKGDIRNEDGSLLTHGNTCGKNLIFNFMTKTAPIGLPEKVSQQTAWDLLLHTHEATEAQLQLSVSSLERFGLVSAIRYAGIDASDDQYPEVSYPLLMGGILQLTPFALAFFEACMEDVGNTGEDTSKR